VSESSIVSAGNGKIVSARGSVMAFKAIAVITGMRKPWRTTFSERDYQRFRALGTEHQQNHPRRTAV